MVFRQLLSHWRKRRFEQQVIARSGLFDPSFYLRKYPDVALSGLNPLKHFLSYGRFERRSPCPAFDTACYLDTNPDVAQSLMDPFVHYILYGRLEGRVADRLDAPSTAVSALEVLKSGLFDPEFYRTLYPDTAACSTSPLSHYLATGRLEHRLPSADFDPGVYLAARPDVQQAGVDPLTHYIEFGQYEGECVLHHGRGSVELAEVSGLITRSGLFDSEYYLRQCPAVRDAGGDALLHYLISGFEPYVSPSPAIAPICSAVAASSPSACYPFRVGMNGDQKRRQFEFGGQARVSGISSSEVGVSDTG